MAACKPDPGAEALSTSAAIVDTATKPVAISKTKKLAAIAMQTNVFAEPNTSSKKIGYLRLGAVVPRSDSPVGTTGCPEGFYAIAPRGYVCIGKTATLDTEAPIVRAASVRPDVTRPLPYAYGFVRAVAPMYLRVPSMGEAQGAEFKLDTHLSWWARKGKQANQPDHLGANDVAHELFPELPAPPPSSSQPQGVLFGGRSDADPMPFWLGGGARTIPNVSGFDVPSASFFANRVKRHTGLAFVGAFTSGAESGDRQFALTVDMRIVPMDKLKPETASTFHGKELGSDFTLPVAFAKPCDPNEKGTPRPCVHTYREEGGKLVRMPELLETRAFVQLTGVHRGNPPNRLLQTKSGLWVRASEVGVAITPETWPQAAERNEKWVDVSIEDQTLVLWEGKKAVFVTAVSTGQDGLGDPKTSKSTPRGTYRIKSKHITATMDSNGRGAQSGGAAPESGESSSARESPTEDDKHAGNFELRDVPYVQYFQDGYALHSAYWHDHFGSARSHGCINLAPIDAMRVFRFTDPPVPEGWHGTTVESGTGTSVVIHR